MKLWHCRQWDFSKEALASGKPLKCAVVTVEADNRKSAKEQAIGLGFRIEDYIVARPMRRGR